MKMLLVRDLILKIRKIIDLIYQLVFAIASFLVLGDIGCVSIVGPGMNKTGFS